MPVFTTNNQLPSECGVFQFRGPMFKNHFFLFNGRLRLTFFTGQENDYQKLLGLCWLKVTFLEFAASNQVNSIREK